MSKSDGSTTEYTGGSVSYYTVNIDKPTAEGRAPYQAECNDIIEALGMSYAEGNAFKALWRRAAAQNLGMSKAGYKDGLYDAEKVVFFGQRLVASYSAPTHIEPASLIDDESPRAEILGQNGEMGEEVYAAVDGAPSWLEAPDWAMWLGQQADGGWEFYEDRPVAMIRHWRHEARGVRVRQATGKDHLNWHSTLQSRPTKDTQ
jgi:hypothetical protein